MSAELVVLRGSQAGRRHPIQESEIAIGRAPECQFTIDDPVAGWRHCSIRFENGRHTLLDFRTAAGTYVNGSKVVERILEDGDQIRLGATVLLFGVESGGHAKETTRTTLLRACSLLFVTEAMADAEDAALRLVFEEQFFQLVADLLPSANGVLLEGVNEAELVKAASSRVSPAELALRMIRGVAADGLFEGEGWTAVPLFVKRSLAGVLAVQGASSVDAGEILAAVATLAGAAWEKSRDVAGLRADNALLKERLGDDPSGMIGESPALKRVLEMIERVAPRDTTVLILGESGTGKELVAHAIHNRSERRDRPFVAINCAALTETLLESEMFGHEKGAFTGAVVQKKGKLEMAEGGTVFLDELGEMAPGLQAKLLRVLQQKEFERVGGTRTMRLNVRLIAATNRDLAAEVKHGAFREDLYHRLNVVALRTPPLRERTADIPLLARHFLERAAAGCRRRVNGIAPEAERLMMAYSWPGNVRELENAIERAVVLGQSDLILPEDLPETVIEAAPRQEISGAFQAKIGDAKRDSIVQAWQQAQGDYKGAAQLLGLHPNSLLRLVRNLGLRDLLKKPGEI